MSGDDLADSTRYTYGTVRLRPITEWQRINSPPKASVFQLRTCGPSDAEFRSGRRRQLGNPAEKHPRCEAPTNRRIEAEKAAANTQLALATEAVEMGEATLAKYS